MPYPSFVSTQLYHSSPRFLASKVLPDGCFSSNGLGDAGTANALDGRIHRENIISKSVTAEEIVERTASLPDGCFICYYSNKKYLTDEPSHYELHTSWGRFRRRSSVNVYQIQ